MAKHKVRIALAVDVDGEWNACGWGNVVKGTTTGDRELMGVATDPLASGENRYFVEVEIEMPEIKVLAAEATPA